MTAIISLFLIAVSLLALSGATVLIYRELREVLDADASMRFWLQERSNCEDDFRVSSDPDEADEAWQALLYAEEVHERAADAFCAVRQDTSPLVRGLYRLLLEGSL